MSWPLYMHTPACTHILALVYVSPSSYTFPSPQTCILALVHMLPSSYMCLSPSPCLMAIVHTSQPSYKCLVIIHTSWPLYMHPPSYTHHRNCTHILPLIHMSLPSYMCPCPHTCVPAMSASLASHPAP